MTGNRKKSFLFLLILLAACNFPLISSQLDPGQERNFSYPYKGVFQAVLTVLKKKGFKIELADAEKGVIRTRPKENTGTFAVVFGGGRYRTTVESRLRSTDHSSTYILLKMIIEKKELGEWDEVEVEPDQLDLLDNDSYELYFGRIAEILKKNP